MRKSQWLLLASLFFIGGIAFLGVIAMPFFILYSFFIFTIVAIIIFWDSHRLRFLFILLLFFLAGAFRYELSRPENIIFNESSTFTAGYLENAGHFSKVLDEKEIFVGTIIEEPETKNDYQNLVIKNKQSDTRALLRANIYPQYFYDQEIEVNCKPNAVDHITSYGRYLAKDHIKFICYYPEIKLLSGKQENGIYKTILGFKQKSKEIIKKSLPDPEAQILSAMVLGYKKDISPQWRDKFSKIGISHIVAISGMHLAIISIILIYFLIRAGLWRKQAFYVTIILLWIFIIMIGAPASAMRAGIMISVVLWAKHLGRVNNIVNVLLLTAALLLLINPLLLFGDIGFQLSFLAVLGIIYFTGIFSSWLRRFPEFYGIKKILIVTLSAQIATFPLSVYHFGNIPVLSLPVNLLIIPILPAVLSLGIAMVGTGFIWAGSAKFLGWIIWPFLSSLLKVVDVFVSLPFSYFYIEEINFIWVAGAYILMGYGVYRIRKGQEFEMLFE